MYLNEYLLFELTHLMMQHLLSQMKALMCTYVKKIYVCNMLYFPMILCFDHIISHCRLKTSSSVSLDSSHVRPLSCFRVVLLLFHTQCATVSYRNRFCPCIVSFCVLPRTSRVLFREYEMNSAPMLKSRRRMSCTLSICIDVPNANLSCLKM